ncbi:MAG: hypothetical protein WC707_03185 [Candidatus Babeliaceae bacterium]
MKTNKIILIAAMLGYATAAQSSYTTTVTTIVGATPMSDSTLHWGVSLFPSIATIMATFSMDSLIRSIHGAAPVKPETQALFDAQAQKLGLTCTVYRFRQDMAEAILNRSGITHLNVRDCIWINEAYFDATSADEKNMVIALTIAHAKNKKTIQTVCAAIIAPIITELVSEKLGEFCNKNINHVAYYAATWCVTKATANMLMLMFFSHQTQKSIVTDAAKILGDTKLLKEYYQKLYDQSGLSVYKKALSTLDAIAQTTSTAQA